MKHFFLALYLFVLAVQGMNNEKLTKIINCYEEQKNNLKELILQSAVEDLSNFTLQFTESTDNRVIAPDFSSYKFDSKKLKSSGSYLCNIINNLLMIFDHKQIEEYKRLDKHELKVDSLFNLHNALKSNKRRRNNNVNFSLDDLGYSYVIDFYIGKKIFHMIGLYKEGTDDILKRLISYMINDDFFYQEELPVVLSLINFCFAGCFKHSLQYENIIASKREKCLDKNFAQDEFTKNILQILFLFKKIHRKITKDDKGFVASIILFQRSFVESFIAYYLSNPNHIMSQLAKELSDERASLFDEMAKINSIAQAEKEKADRYIKNMIDREEKKAIKRQKINIKKIIAKEDPIEKEEFVIDCDKDEDKDKEKVLIYSQMISMKDIRKNNNTTKKISKFYTLNNDVKDIESKLFNWIDIDPVDSRWQSILWGQKEVASLINMYDIGSKLVERTEENIMTDMAYWENAAMEDADGVGLICYKQMLLIKVLRDMVKSD